MRILATLLAILLHFNAVHAGTLAKGDGRLCDWIFEGQIVKGDAARLETLRGGVDGKTLCLNSPGGSLLEGQAMFHLLWSRNLNTAILPGHQCASACAIAFLGGSTAQGTDLVRFMNRAIFPGAALGFHGPSLSLPQDTQNYPAKTVNTSFELALKAAEQFFLINRTEDRGNKGLTDHLYHRILTTRADQMYWIKTVGDAILADVDLRGVRYPQRLNDQAVRNICDNLYLRGGFPSATGTTETIDPGFIDTSHAIAGLTRDRVEGFFAVAAKDGKTGFAGPYYSGTKYYLIECHVIDGSEALGEINERYLAGANFHVSLRSSSDERDPKRVNLGAWYKSSNDLQERFVPAWYALPFNAPIDQLTPGKTLATARTISGVAASKIAAAPDQFISFIGFDLGGGDLRHVKAHDPATCVAACRAASGCDAVTYDRWNRICFLKSVDRSRGELLQMPKATSFVSGGKLAQVRRSDRPSVIKKRSGKGFFDKTNLDAFTANAFQNCAWACESYPNCLALNYQPKRKWCELYEAPGEYFDRKGYEIGLKYQTN